MPAPLHVVFAGGVTLGHLNPALAVAAELCTLAPEVRITFVGPGSPRDRRAVEAAGYEYHSVSCPRVPRPAWRFLGFVRSLGSGRVATTTLFDRQPPAVVVGLGGYASVPAALAARKRRVPLVLLEPNAVWGRANRWLARWATVACTAFEGGPETSGLHLPFTRRDPSARSACRIVVTGTPVHSTFLTQTPRDDSRPVLLVTGGSSGASALNRCVPLALGRIARDACHLGAQTRDAEEEPSLTGRIGDCGGSLAGWRVVHQTGLEGVAVTSETYRAAGVPATVTGHVADMAGLLRQTGLVVCRAGGSTLAELAAVGVPAILVPYPQATDDHQSLNAQAFATAGAAVAIQSRGMDDAALTARLEQELCRLLTDVGARHEISTAIRRLASPQAAAKVAGVVLEIARNRSPRAIANQKQRRTEPPNYPSSLPWIDTPVA